LAQELNEKPPLICAQAFGELPFESKDNNTQALRKARSLARNADRVGALIVCACVPSHQPPTLEGVNRAGDSRALQADSFG
jgi:hypothetical protein